MKLLGCFLLLLVLAAAAVFWYLGDRSGEVSDVEPSRGTLAVQVFFGNSREDPEALRCDVVYPVERRIPRVEAVARAALEELLRGPTVEEQERGFFTSINPGVRLQSLSVSGGVARVDFDPRLQEGVAGACRVAAIRAQIGRTLRQFSTIQEGVISINGETEAILQP